MSVDKHSETWAAVSDCLEQEQSKVQKVMLSKGVSHDDSNYWRGYYAALARINALAVEPEAIEVVTVNY